MYSLLLGPPESFRSPSCFFKPGPVTFSPVWLWAAFPSFQSLTSHYFCASWWHRGRWMCMPNSCAVRALLISGMKRRVTHDGTPKHRHSYHEGSGRDGSVLVCPRWSAPSRHAERKGKSSASHWLLRGNTTKWRRWSCKRAIWNLEDPWKVFPTWCVYFLQAMAYPSLWLVFYGHFLGPSCPLADCLISWVKFVCKIE